MSQINQSQSVLARLLAKENIKIQHGNFSTAFFDVKHRILGLPNWKDTTKDVYDLLCGHEVGHALYTPANSFDGQLPVRKDLLNIVEDVRIERMIQQTYPGLIRCFQSGYSQLKDKNFFGINGRDVDSLGLVDRINLKAKLGNLIQVKFSRDEEVIREKIHAAQTWQEVLEATALLEKFLNEAKITEKKSQQQEQADSAKESGSDDQQDDSDAGDDQQDGEASDAQGQTDGEDDSTTEETNSTDGLDAEKSEDQTAGAEKAKADAGAEATEADAEADEDQPVDTTGQDSSGRNADPTSSDVVETQQAFDINSKSLLDTSKETLNTFFAQAPTNAELDEVVVPYAKLRENRMLRDKFVAAHNDPVFHDQFLMFMKNTRKAVGLLIKEFELRKAAYQYSRATVAKTGSLNVERLHAYKVSDDLFLSVTKLADAKNHAMLMFVDYSGSMQSTLPHVLKHLINLALFCRNLGIPFRVYAFSTDGGFITPKRTPYYMNTEEAGYDRVVISNLNLLELTSSELNKADFNDSIFALWLRSEHIDLCGSGEGLGNTPLNETIIAAHKLVTEFKAKYNPDRMLSIFLTDGDGQSLKHVMGADHNRSRLEVDGSYWTYNQKLRFKLNGRYVQAENKEMTTALMENLRITTGCEAIGFFIPQSKSLLRQKATFAIATSKKINPASAHGLWAAKFEKEYNENDVICFPNGLGYTNYFIVASGEELSIDDDEEIGITEDMTRGRMAKVFTKYSKAKRANRVFVTKFAEALA